MRIKMVGLRVRARSWMATSLAAGALACGGTAVESGADGDAPPDCVGDYSGSYDGDVRGNIEGSLSNNWSFTVTFSPNNEDTSYTISGRVAEDGGIDISQGSSLTGTFNFNRCRASGRWNTGEANGNWNASLQ